MTPENEHPPRVVTIENVPREEHVVGGQLMITEEAVSIIAGVAARAVPGVHALGNWRFIPLFDRLRRGVVAEVGKTEAALDLEVVLEFGTDIRALAADVRAAVGAAIDRMAGRRVVEVNLRVVGIVLPDEVEQKDEVPPLR